MRGRHKLTIHFSWERGQTRVFADRAEDIVLHQDSMELLGCGVKERKPDRIFGLEKTTMFEKYVSAEENENLRHSPFADGRILYPFLIIEAKSEKGSPGFDSIESQTAFPIRTLLQLQDKLALQTGTKINPLLWFLANQGEEWRVYAAVVDNSQFVGLFELLKILQTDHPEACFRFVARNNFISGLCSATSPDHRLYMRLGTRHLSS